MPARDRAVVFVVDDDPDDRMLISRALASCTACKIVEIADGPSLLAALRERLEKPAVHDADNILVLLDINMPRLSGIETLEAMKADPALRRIPTIMLTTSDSPDTVSRCYELGANAFVRKPSTFSDLERAMAAINDFWFEVVRIAPTRRS